MDVKLLGPLDVRLAGRSVVPSAAKPRQILAMLALGAGRMVTVPTLMEELWGSRLPRSAVPTLQTYILQLRRLMAATGRIADQRDAKDILVTRYGGYLLDIPAGAVDAYRFEQLCGQGRRSLAAADPASCSRILTEALACWDGSALVDVRLGPRLETEVIRLQACRQEALHNRIEADLQLGHHHQLLPELGVLVAELPMHEDFSSQYMLALHRSGRSWLALQEYNRLRHNLVDQLGSEPSRATQQLQLGILNADPILDRPDPRSVSHLALVTAR